MTTADKGFGRSRAVLGRQLVLVSEQVHQGKDTTIDDDVRTIGRLVLPYTRLLVIQ
jgi:hypothetical protein